MASRNSTRRRRVVTRAAPPVAPTAPRLTGEEVRLWRGPYPGAQPRRVKEPVAHRRVTIGDAETRAKPVVDFGP